MLFVKEGLFSFPLDELTTSSEGVEISFIELNLTKSKLFISSKSKRLISSCYNSQGHLITEHLVQLSRGSHPKEFR